MMEEKILRDGSMVRITLDKNLTAVEVPEFQMKLKQEIASGARTVVFDFTKTVSLDSTAIGLLIATNNSLDSLQGLVRLVNVSPEIMELLRNMRLTLRLNVSTTEQEAPHG